MRQWTAETHCPRAWQQTQNSIKNGFDKFKDNSSITGPCQSRACENLPASLVAGRVLESMDKSVGFHKIAASITVDKNALPLPRGKKNKWGVWWFLITTLRKTIGLSTVVHLGSSSWHVYVPGQEGVGGTPRGLPWSKSSLQGAGKTQTRKPRVSFPAVCTPHSQGFVVSQPLVTHSAGDARSPTAQASLQWPQEHLGGQQCPAAPQKQGFVTPFP